MAVKKRKRKRISIAIVQFTFKNVLYKLDDKFDGTQKETESLINKNYLKWQ